MNQVFTGLSRSFLLLCVTLCFVSATAQTDTNTTAETTQDFVFGDPLPDAPELAPRGPYSVGVRTVQTVNPDQLDVLAVTPEDPNPRYDRPLTVEVFYPGTVPEGQQALTTYRDVYGFGPNNPERPEHTIDLRRTCPQRRGAGRRRTHPTRSWCSRTGIRARG